MAEDVGDKTEDATPRKREEARKQGNVVQSTDLTAAGLMLTTAAGFYFFFIPIASGLSLLMRQALSQPVLQLDELTVAKMFQEIGQHLGWTVLPFMLMMAVAAVMMSVSQVGIVLSNDVLQPKLSRLNPLSGMQRIFSMKASVKLVVSLIKLVIVVTVAGWAISALLPRALVLVEVEPQTIFGEIHYEIVQLAFQLALAMLVLAMFDYAFQKWKHEQDLKMTKQEVRDEMKNMEGDPLIRQRRREAHRKLAEAREMQQVQNADVLINNPTHISIAIKYDPTVMDAPIVLAKGRGEIARRMREIARMHNIPMIERKPLAQELYKTVKVGHPIPVDLYEAFVEIMAYVYRISGKKPPVV